MSSLGSRKILYPNDEVNTEASVLSKKVRHKLKICLQLFLPEQSAYAVAAKNVQEASLCDQCWYEWYAEEVFVYFFDCRWFREMINKRRSMK